jgi:hypothetical protein
VRPIERAQNRCELFGVLGAEKLHDCAFDEVEPEIEVPGLTGNELVDIIIGIRAPL